MPHLPGERGENVMQAPGRWDYRSVWYHEARKTDDCLNPDTAHRVEFCHCRLCSSKLTDPRLVQGAR